MMHDTVLPVTLQPMMGRLASRARQKGGSLKTVCVIQHTEAEHLGLVEDHLESRSIRFQYFRPFTKGGAMPVDEEAYDGLILLGGGPLGIVSGPLLPSLAPELRMTERFLRDSRPVLGFGTGSILLAVAAGGGADEAPLRFEVGLAERSATCPSGQFLPETFPYAAYLRDRPVLPENSETLASDHGGEPVVFSVGGKSFGFIGHPGIKSAMVEDLIMEFEETPDNTAGMLEQLRENHAGIAQALNFSMVGLVRECGWMD